MSPVGESFRESIWPVAGLDKTSLFNAELISSTDGRDAVELSARRSVDIHQLVLAGVIREAALGVVLVVERHYLPIRIWSKMRIKKFVVHIVKVVETTTKDDDTRRRSDVHSPRHST